MFCFDEINDSLLEGLVPEEESLRNNPLKRSFNREPDDGNVSEFDNVEFRGNRSKFSRVIEKIELILEASKREERPVFGPVCEERTRDSKSGDESIKSECSDT
ncbi:unnamed protein product [Pneumocystis jirovecii]|uniref:Uncharacterized protein n=1 Tax=Pneumocystis jirovecii TaxID=42068 RepID=L0PIP0_PNEJI|nr:unnamed protein product [Pneumocystis jirovecii]